MIDYEYDEELYEDYGPDSEEFADPGGISALRAATPDNPRIYECPTCHEPNRLTAKDVSLHYQCDQCADHDENGF